MRINRYPRFHPLVANGLQRAMQVRACFIVDREHLCPASLEVFDVAIRINNHQVNIQRLGCVFVHRFHHRHTKRDIGNKHAIHHIHMKPIGMRTVNHFNIALKVGEIGGKNTGCNAIAHGIDLHAKVDNTPSRRKYLYMKFLIDALFTIAV